jgi:glycosyltransferase involved in cell wall biosynthesis
MGQEINSLLSPEHIRALRTRLVRTIRNAISRSLIKPEPMRIYDLQLEKNPSANFPMRALVAYLVHPFSISRTEPSFYRHINVWHAQAIVRVLNKLGYVVDVVDYQDNSFNPHRHYDLFIGHGGINFWKISRCLSAQTVKIYFSTGCYWKFHNKAELNRFASLRKRRGLRLPLDRFIYDSEEKAIRTADGIIGLGNKHTRESYEGFSPVIMLPTTTVADEHLMDLGKDFENGRHHFLYYAGLGCVHKGLDLLLEAFSKLDEHLWICCKLEKSFAKAYLDELLNRSNIHTVGWIEPRSPTFYQIMNICNFAVLPSCSEGGAQSVVECMNQGVIPIVTTECGLSIDGYGYILRPCTTERIIEMIKELSSLSPSKCEELSLKTKNAATTTFSEEMFLQGFERALLSILETASKRLEVQVQN